MFSFLWGAHEEEELLSQMITTFYFLRELDSVLNVTVLSAMPEHPNSPNSQYSPTLAICLAVHACVVPENQTEDLAHAL